MTQKVSHGNHQRPSKFIEKIKIKPNNLSFVESSSQEYRDQKEKEKEKEHEFSSSDSDDDDDDETDYSKATSDKSKFQMDLIQQFLKQKLGLGTSTEDEGEASAQQVLKTVDFQGVVDHWKENGFKKIVTMVGAGISTCK